MERGNRRLQYLIVSAISSTSVTTGVSFAWITPVLPKFARNEVGFQINHAEMSWVVAISSLGFVLGSGLSRTTSDRCGRRPTIIGGAVPMLIGTILLIYAREVWMLSTGRFLWGCGTGFMAGVSLFFLSMDRKNWLGIGGVLLYTILCMTLYTFRLRSFNNANSTALVFFGLLWFVYDAGLNISVMYIAEVVDKDIRGSMSISNRFMMSLGCLIAITVGTNVSFSTLNYMLAVLPLMIFAVCWWIPESPYYLLMQGKVDAARKTMQMLTNIRDEEILEEKLSQMKSHVTVEMSRSDTFKEFLVGKRHRKAIWIVAAIKIPQIFTGIHPIQNYLGLILIESKSEINVSTAIIVYGCCRFLLGIMSSILVDRVGRRPLLIYSFLGTGVVLTLTAVFFGVQAYHDIVYPYTLIPFILILLSVIISVVGYESVCYLITAELFPLNVKSIAVATSSVFGGFNNFIAVKSLQQIKDWVGLFGLFTIYAIAAFLGAISSYTMMPETKGKSLKEIQTELNGIIYDEEEKLNKVTLDNVEESESTNKCNKN